MLCYAVIDTNILVSSLLSKRNDSATVQVIGRVITGDIIPLYSNQMIKEYKEVLCRKKFGFSYSTVNYLIKAFEKFGIQVEPSPIGEILPDLKDLPFYEVVMEKRRDGAYLVTGNIKHFPERDFIVTARQLIDILEQKE